MCRFWIPGSPWWGSTPRGFGAYRAFRLCKVTWQPRNYSIYGIISRQISTRSTPDYWTVCMRLTQECLAAPINNCVLIIHMILSASQLNVHTCVVDVPYPKYILNFRFYFFLIETVEKAQKLTFTVLNRTNCSWNKIGRWIEISGSQNPEMLPCARKLNIYSEGEGCVSGQLGRLKGCACLCWPKIWLRIKWWRSRRTEGHPNNKFTDLKCLRCRKFGKFHLSKGVID